MDNVQLRDCFVRAIHLFKNKPSMLRQAMLDANMYQQTGELSEADLTMLRRLAAVNSYSQNRVDFNKVQ
ncbi:MAG: hypothetical protein EBZ49_00970 [Proteobacteria bacterium]|nr:hypothetical protein [Pseudomonadota bacterium]